MHVQLQRLDGWLAMAQLREWMTFISSVDWTTLTRLTEWRKRKKKYEESRQEVTPLQAGSSSSGSKWMVHSLAAHKERASEGHTLTQTAKIFSSTAWICASANAFLLCLRSRERGEKNTSESNTYSSCMVCMKLLFLTRGSVDVFCSSLLLLVPWEWVGPRKNSPHLCTCFSASHWKKPEQVGVHFRWEALV